jgi:exopolysaccharide biosynthesis WecB/TagA/CpsF family protein
VALTAGFVAPVLATLLTAAGVLVAAAVFYLVVLAVACRFHAPAPRAEADVRPRLAVLVPAHDEAGYIGRCLETLREQDYPSELYEVVVIADNCTDATATIAASSGATVMERDDPTAPGKGRALRWAIDRLFGSRSDIDGVVVVDGDSVADRHLISGLAARLASGADAVQGEYLALTDGDDARSELRSASMLLFHRVRFGGRAALGLPCHLVGNGMAFSRHLLEDHPWDAYTSAEDLEWSADLRLAGIRPQFAADARLRAPIAKGGAAARTQRIRWEGGRLHVIRTRVPRLVRAMVHGRWSLFDAVVELLVPPLGVLAVASVAGAVATTLLYAIGIVPGWTVVPWIAGCAGIVLFVVGGLWAGRAPSSTFRALLAAPLLVLGDTRNRLRLLRGTRAGEWHRTERPTDRPTNDEPTNDRHANDGRTNERSLIGGVPVDPVDLDMSIDRAMTAVRDRRFMQICTVNLDFVVNARRNTRVRSVLSQSELNLADGSPVLWLGRLTGRRIPERVAGADFVPHLAEAATEAGASVFFLGGENGAAAAAAHVMQKRIPGLRVGGVYEPARAALEDIDTVEIVRRLDETKPDILFVAFGHPKQDLWIAANRDRLPVSVAIGVGCTFDLIAGQRRRAPAWMQRAGLEWLFRVSNEPSRLAKRYAIDGYWLLAVLFPLSLQQRFFGRRALEAAVPEGSAL